MKTVFKFMVCALIILIGTNSNCQELLSSHSLRYQHFGIRNQNQTPSRDDLWANSKYLVSKPGFTKYYEWVDNSWKNITNSTYTYNEKGVLIEEDMNYMVQGDTKYNFIWIYDDHDNLIEYTVNHWINKNWEIYLSQKMFYTYDGNGHILDVMSQIFEEDVWINFWKTEYELGPQGEWISYIEYTWEDEAWTNTLRHRDIVWYSWSNRLIESYIEQIWDNGWVNNERYNFTYNLNAYNGLKEKYIEEVWILYERETFTFNELEEVDYFEMYVDEVWVNSEMYTYIYDEVGSITRYTYEYWEEEDWEIDTDVKFILTYSGNNDLEEEIVQLWDITNQVWFNIQRYLNYNFQYFELGLKENKLEAQIEIYPNPVSSIFSLDFEGEAVNKGVVQIFNVSGQKVFDKKLTNNQNEIDVSFLPKGMYIMQLKLNEKDVFHQKMLKQ